MEKYKRAIIEMMKEIHEEEMIERIYNLVLCFYTYRE